METTLQRCLGIVKQGDFVRVSFLERKVFVKGKAIELDLSDIPKTGTVGEALELVEGLYERYKHSRPNAESKHESISAYFEAIPYEELPPEYLLNEPREEERIRLEVTVLGLIVNGSLWWDESVFKGWRYVSESGLTLKKRWIALSPATSPKEGECNHTGC